jgi:hypothetical protein
MCGALKRLFVKTFFQPHTATSTPCKRRAFFVAGGQKAITIFEAWSRKIDA